MNINIKSYGKTNGPAKFIQLTVETTNGTLTEDITNLKGEVSSNFIEQLEYIVQELKEQNNLIYNNNY